MAEVILLDASAFIAGYDPSEAKAEQYTVQSVKDELEKDELLKIRLETAISQGKIKILSPDGRYLSAVDDVLTELGESGFVSEADSELLALSLKLKGEGKKPIIISDDYSIQNIASHLDIAHRGMSTKGIKRRFTWSIYCPGCRRHFDKPQIEGVCPVCGMILKRKPVKKGVLNKES